MTKDDRNVLTLSKLSKQYAHTDEYAIRNLSLKVKQGEIYGFLGPNGAGKTTTIRLIMDYIRPSAGQIKIFGSNIQDSGVKSRMKIGFLSADSVLYANWSGHQHIKFIESVRGASDKAISLAQQFGLDLDTKYYRLSSGNKQKLGLVLALMNEPDLLILDEPTRGLDPLLQQAFYKILKEYRRKGGAVFMSSHNLSEVELVCDRVGIIKNGRLVASETMQSLRRMHVHEVRALFSGGFNESDFKLDNIEIKNSTNNEIIANVRGDLNEFLSTIAQYKVRDIEITHISLEELFLRYYE